MYNRRHTALNWSLYCLCGILLLTLLLSMQGCSTIGTDSTKQALAEDPSCSTVQYGQANFYYPQQLTELCRTGSEKTQSNLADDPLTDTGGTMVSLAFALNTRSAETAGYAKSRQPVCEKIRSLRSSVQKSLLCGSARVPG